MFTTLKKLILKHKIVSGIVALIVLLTIGFFFFDSGPERIFQNTVGPPPEDPEARKAWFSEKMVSMDMKTYILDEKLPSWKELDEINQSLSPKTKYPRYIKAVQTYGTTPNLVEVLYFADVLKDMGVNTQFVHANYWLKNGKFQLWYTSYDSPKELNQDGAKRALVHNILLAKQQGLAVILFPDYFQLEDGGMAKHNISDDLESRLETIALELAPIAEKYHVEYLVPSNQIEMIFESNGYSVEEAQRRTNAFYASVVPKIRKIYSGKIMYKMGGFGRWGNYEGISLKGADIFGFTACLNRNRDDLDRVVFEIKEASAMANKLSQQYGVPWFNAEFVISSDEVSGGSQVAQILPIEEYYEEGLAAFNQHGKSAVGFTVHSLLTTGKVYDTPAMPLIKEFFASKP
jgi:hypothetical protein